MVMEGAAPTRLDVLAIWRKGNERICPPLRLWRNQQSPIACQYCSTFHNSSIHGVIGLCTNEANPVVTAWLDAWGPHLPFVLQWRRSAGARDRFLLGKLVLPDSLVACLKASLGNRRALSAVRHFHTHILPGLSDTLPPWTADDRRSFKRKLNPYNPAGWDVGPSALPPHPLRSRRRLLPRGLPCRPTARLPNLPPTQPSITSCLSPRCPPSTDQCS